VIKWFGEYVKQNPNIEANKSKFNIIALDSTAPKVIETKKEIPTKDSIVETDARISRNSKGYLACGEYCAVSAEYSSKLGCKARIKCVVDNTSASAKSLPYMATKIEIIE
jgi:hypothetical protein